MLVFGDKGAREAPGKKACPPMEGAPRRRGPIASKLGAAALLVALVAPVPAVASGDQAAGQAYRLRPGDRITVTVFGQPELSGDVLVDEASAIELPFIGPVSVKDMTAPECQKAITSRLADGVLVKPAVSVRISELRPIYVLGDVRTPGAYPFRYGSTVKSALAAAGGFGLTAIEQGTAVSEFLLADERVNELTHEQLALLVRRARLEAQRDGAAKFQPPAPPDSADANDFAAAVAIETVTFSSQSTVLKDQLDLVRSQKPRLENEIKAVNSQIAIEKQQEDIIQQQVDQYGGLLKRGLGLASADMQLKLDRTARESDIWRLEAEVSRLQMDQGELDIKLEDIESAFRKQVIADLRDVQEKIAELRISLDAARAVREARLQQAGSIAGLLVEHTLTVTRERDGKTTTTPADDGMALQPGDIVEIDKILPVSASSIAKTSRQTRLAPGENTGATGSGADNASAAR